MNHSLVLDRIERRQRLRDNEIRQSIRTDALAISLLVAFVVIGWAAARWFATLPVQQ